MLALLFTLLLAVALILSAGTIIGTWRRYGASWDALNVEMAAPARRRIVTIRVVQNQPARIFAHQAKDLARPDSLAYQPGVSELKTKSPALAQHREWRAAA